MCQWGLGFSLRIFRNEWTVSTWEKFSIPTTPRLSRLEIPRLGLRNPIEYLIIWNSFEGNLANSCSKISFTTQPPFSCITDMMTLSGATWASSDRGYSSEASNRALEWYIMSAADVLDILPKSHPGYNKIRANRYWQLVHVVSGASLPNRGRFNQ